MHKLACRCGHVQGQVLSGRPSCRVRCYCTDCQAFARFLRPKGDFLDDQGGTEIVQVAQSRLRIERGLERVDCIRLTDKGMIRWYASCCRTPIGNTMPTQGLGFIGLITACLDQASLAQDFGSKTALVSTRSATGDPKPVQTGLVPVLGKFLAIVLSTRLLPRYAGSQLFQNFDTPIRRPRVLTPEELAELKGAA